MDPLVVAAMLAASLLHASWHALVKSGGDGVVALAGMNLVSGTASIAVIPLVGTLPPAAALVVAGSVLLHIGYKIALARLYARADLSRAYPLARGITPLVAAMLAAVALGEQPGTQGFVGLVLVSAGVLALALERGGAGSLRSLVAAIAAGVAVATYSVVDAYGVRITGNWLTFTAWLIAADSIAFVAYALATRGPVCIRTWRTNWPRVLVSGCLGSVSFCVFMWALGRAPVGMVAALRETSVMFAAVIGIAVLGERATFARGASAVAVTVGIATIAITRST